MNLQDALDRVNNPSTFAHGLVSTSLYAGLSLVEPRRLTVGQRFAFRTAVAAASAWSTWVGTRSVEEFDAIGPLGRVWVTAGAAGLVMGLSEVGEALDARLHDGLIRRGVRRPRLCVAAGTAALSLGAFWAGQGESGHLVESEDDVVESGEALSAVPENVRELVEAILASTDEYGAPQLRMHLSAAQLVSYDEEAGEAEFWPFVQFRVPESLPRAVPGNATFPFVGRFRGMDDRTFDVRVAVENGYLDSVVVEEADDWSLEEWHAWNEDERTVGDLHAWPAPKSIRVLSEDDDDYAAAKS